MANKRIIQMLQKQIIRLKEQGYSIRKISKELGIHRKTVTSYIKQYQESGLSIEEALEDDGKKISEKASQTPQESTDPRYEKMLSFVGKKEDRVNIPNFTIGNLYNDYKNEIGNDLYSKSQFYRILNKVWNPPKGSIRLNHTYGEKLYVDYTGKKLNYTNKQTGEVTSVEILVTILPASQYIYLQAMHSQKKEDFINGIIKSLEYIDGVPKAIVTDNLKSAVTKVNKYQSTINKSLQDMALHYGTTIDPTRAYHPKDKALVESAVKICYNAIFYHVQKHTHFSLDQLNASLWKHLEALNNRQLSNKDVSRHDQFRAEHLYLAPLPMYPYEIKQYRKAKVQKMGYVICSTYKNYYSVPYRYIGKQVELKYDHRTLEVYYLGQRIAMHTTSQAKGHYVTNPDHLSSNNRAYTEWSPEYFSKKASEYGKEIQSYVEQLIEQRPYPEQAYKQVQGIFKLVRVYTAERVCDACKLASRHTKYSYRMIQQILENNQDQLAHHKADDLNLQVPPHDNVRGKEYYK